MPVISNVRHRNVQIQMQDIRGAFALRCWATAARAARPASLASSARTAVLDAIGSQASARSATPKTFGARVSIPAVSGSFATTFRVRSFHSPSTQDSVRFSGASRRRNSMVGKAKLELPQTQALRRSAKPNTRGRAGTSCFAARAGGVRLLARGVTQRTMRAGCGASSAA